MKRVRWFLIVTITALALVGCGDKKNSTTSKTPPPAVEVAPPATVAAILPEVQSGGGMRPADFVDADAGKRAVTPAYAYSLVLCQATKLRQCHR